MTRSAVLGQRVALGHRVEVDGVRCCVVPPVTFVEDAPLAQERQRDRDVGEGDVTARIAFVLEQRLEREALLSARFRRPDGARRLHAFRSAQTSASVRTSGGSRRSAGA